MSRARARILTRAAWLPALAALALPAAAGAHAVLVSSLPALRAAVTRAPGRVELTFSERLEPAYATVSVWNAAGARVDLGDGGVAASDPRRLTVSLPPLPPGRYRVRYRVLSVDGHVAASEFPFTVTGGP